MESVAASDEPTAGDDRRNQDHAADEPPDDFEDFEDFDDEAFLEAWDAAESEAADVLTSGLDDLSPIALTTDGITDAADDLRSAYRHGDRAAGWMLRAAGIADIGQPTEEKLLVAAVAQSSRWSMIPGSLRRTLQT